MPPFLIMGVWDQLLQAPAVSTSLVDCTQIVSQEKAIQFSIQLLWSDHLIPAIGKEAIVTPLLHLHLCHQALSIAPAPPSTSVVIFIEGTLPWTIQRGLRFHVGEKALSIGHGQSSPELLLFQPSLTPIFIPLACDFVFQPPCWGV